MLYVCAFAIGSATCMNIRFKNNREERLEKSDRKNTQMHENLNLYAYALHMD